MTNDNKEEKKKKKKKGGANIMARFASMEKEKALGASAQERE